MKGKQIEKRGQCVGFTLIPACRLRFPRCNKWLGLSSRKQSLADFHNRPQRGPQSIAESINKEGPVGIHLQGLSHARFPRPMSGFALVHYLPITPASASAEAGVRQEYDRILLQPCHTSPFFRLCCWAPSCWSSQRRHGLNKPPMRVRNCSKFLHRPVCPTSCNVTGKACEP
ncbi:MAG: hypothetical protein RJB68_499 [Pseudomonadota bacterium]|jgi:hypothetical protein